MTNSERLLRELRRHHPRGCTRQELESAGVTHVEIEIDRLRARGAAIHADRLPRSGQRRWRMFREPDRAVDRPDPSRGGFSEIDCSLDVGTLFDTPAPKPTSPYDLAKDQAA
jgi:hypothetical protein